MLKEVPAAVKTKLTKAYNKLHQVEKFKKTKVKASDQMLKYDPVLEEFENLKIDDDEEQEQEMIPEKKPKKTKK